MAAVVGYLAHCGSAHGESPIPPEANTGVDHNPMKPILRQMYTCGHLGPGLAWMPSQNLGRGNRATVWIRARDCDRVSRGQPAADVRAAVRRWKSRARSEHERITSWCMLWVSSAC